ncbi:MAG TPA: ATP-binding protein, partial [Azospirillaceae bacterium]|nr:ATP-binding protein [Azospirillaceae bacterium]
NLLSNAVKFTATGTVTVTVLRVPGQTSQTKFLITDTGIGIQPDKQPILFEKFSQADQSISRDYGGTGLGLAICKRLVEAMGGTIGIHSVAGVGSTFWFALPLPATAAPMPAVSAVPASAPGAAERQGRILLVEDVEMNQELATRMLRSAGHKVTVAGDGAAALAALNRRTFDLVLMDVQMPVMDGLEATRAIRALEGPTARIPVIAMTAGALPEEIDRCRAAGMDGHLTKPVDRDALLAGVARWLEGRPVTPVEPSPADTAPAALPVLDLPVLDLPVLDLAVIDRHCAEIGTDTARDLLLLFRKNLRKYLQSAEDEPVDWTRLGRDSHTMVSMAGSLGFAELVDISRTLTRACEAPEEKGADALRASYRAAADRADEAADRKLQEIERLLADAVAG